MKLTFILPTCEPRSMFQFLLPSIHYLKPVKHLLEFNICFQPPYTKKEVKEVLNEFKRQHIKVNYMFKNYKVIKPYIPLLKMRNDCAMMSPNSDIYGLIDDDMSFESGDIVECINMMVRAFKVNSKLSVIAFYNGYKVNYKENFYSTNAGLFYRGGKYFGFKGLVPRYLNDFNKKVYTRVPYNNENLINLFGGHQDKFCAMIRLATGTYGKQIIGVPVNHLENRVIRGDEQHGWKDAEVIEGSIADFILKYFNENFIKTHALTLFDKETDKKIYPYKYENNELKLEYNIYNKEGMLDGYFIDNISQVYTDWNITYENKLCIGNFARKNLAKLYKHLKDINLDKDLPESTLVKISSYL